MLVTTQPWSHCFSDHFGGFVCLAEIVSRTLPNTRYAASSVLPLSKTHLDMRDLCLKQQLEQLKRGFSALERVRNIRLYIQFNIL